MNITHGMDIAAVRQLAALLRNKAEEIETISSTLTAQLGNTAWNGPDADAFRSDWAGTHCSQLKAVVNALGEASTRATSNAARQEEISAS